MASQHTAARTFGRLVKSQEFVIDPKGLCDECSEPSTDHFDADRVKCERDAMELLVAELLLKNQQLRFALNDARELIDRFKCEVMNPLVRKDINESSS